MATPRSSVFTFESTVHSSHVLQWLNEQRCRDLLCDVTVVVEGQSFRAHRSVLASCSEYFAQRISSLAQHGAVITLPEEVTVVGFEPLLKFAYTSKLHFRKDDVLKIQHSSSVLGFKDLDEACFDFLLPKLFSSNKSPASFVRKTCCKTTCKRRFTKENGGTDSDGMLLDDKEVKPVADSSSQQDTDWDHSKSVKKKTGSLNSAVSVGPPVEEMDVAVLQCPKYRKFQLACKKETSVNEKSLTDPVKSRIRDPCALSCFPCSSSARCKIKTPPKEVKGGAKEPQKSETHEAKTENSEAPREVDPVKKDALEGKEKRDEKIAEDNFQEKMEHTSGMSPLDISSIKIVSPESSPMLSESSSESSLPHCPLSISNEERVICRPVQHEEIGSNVTENQETMNPAAPEPGSVHQNMPVGDKGKSPYDICQDGGNGRQTGSMERAAILIDNTRESTTKEKDEGHHLPKSLRLGNGTSQQTFQDFQAGCSSNTGSRWVQSSSLEWPKPQSDLCSPKVSCPYLLDLEPMNCMRKHSGLSECEVASQSGVSSMTSGEDGDSETETEGDCEFAARERARQVQLPYSVDWIVNLSRNDFQQLLKQQTFTQEQLDFVHDMRRRSKNRLAAQRCRKRKLDCIYNLQCEINKLKTEREKLILEKNQLSQMKVKTCHSVNTLCQRVCGEANLQPEQLQVLAKFTSSDCPMSSFFPHIDMLLSENGLPLHPHASLVDCSGGYEFVSSEKDPSSLSRDTTRGQHSL